MNLLRLKIRVLVGFFFFWRLEGRIQASPASGGLLWPLTWPVPAPSKCITPTSASIVPSPLSDFDHLPLQAPGDDSGFTWIIQDNFCISRPLTSSHPQRVLLPHKYHHHGSHNYNMDIFGERWCYSAPHTHHIGFLLGREEIRHRKSLHSLMGFGKLLTSLSAAIYPSLQ